MANYEPIPKGGKNPGAYLPTPLHLTKAALSKSTPFKLTPNGGKTRPAPHDLPLPGPKNNLKPTPGKTPAPKRTVLPAPKTVPKKPSYTAAQEATLHAKQLLAPQYKQADVEAARQNEAIRRFTADAMQQLAGLAPQIGQDYTSALDAQSGLVNSAADALRNSNPQTNVSALLNSIGAPAAQQQSATQGLSDAFNGAAAVGQYSDSLPIGTLRSQGLAAETLARLQPGFTALGGRQAQITALQNQSDARAKIGEQLPALEQSWLSSFQSNKAKQQQLALEANALGLKTQNQNFNQNLQTAKLKNQQNEFIATYKQRAQTAGLKYTQPNSSLSRSVGYLVDGSGNPILDANGKRQILPGFNTNAQGRVVKNPKLTSAGLKSSKPFGNLTKTQVSTLRSTANELRFGTVYQGKNPMTFVGKTYNSGDRIPPTPYGQAVSFLVGHGFSRKDAVAMLNNFYPKSARLSATEKVKLANKRAKAGKDSSGLGIQLP